MEYRHEPEEYWITLKTGLMGPARTLLGIGRAKPGERPLFRIILETCAVAVTAAIAGALVGLMLS